MTNRSEAACSRLPVKQVSGRWLVGVHRSIHPMQDRKQMFARKGRWEQFTFCCFLELGELLVGTLRQTNM